MPKIPSEEICIDPSSYVDPYGRVFLWNGRVFRGIAHEHVEHIKRLMRSSTIQRLQSNGMVIETHIPTETTDQFGLLIEHRRIHNPSYCFEWPPQMLKDAALLTLNICLEISDEHLTLQDAYPWNIFFDGTKPVFIDFGSFVPARDDVLWAPYEQFCNFFLYPLYLYAAGLYEPARRFFYDYLGGLPQEQFFRLAPLSLKARYPFGYAKHSLSYHLTNAICRMKLEERMRSFIHASYQTKKGDLARGRTRFLRSLFNEVEAITIHAPKSYWQTYYHQKEMCSYKEEAFAQKEKIVYDVLHRLKPSTVFDAGCNTGIYSFLAAKSGARVIAVDTDEPSVSILYQGAKERGADILPLVLDVLNPTSQFGWCAKQFPSAIERFRADMVFAFALIHHIAISSRQGFERVLETLDSFSNKYIFLEFVDKDDPKVKQLMAQSVHTYLWYSFEEFQRTLTRRYRHITFFDPHSLTRRFILYEK